MNLNEITANIRLRNPWEAIDLGFSMVQKWWKSIYLALSLVTFCIAAIIYFLTPNGNLWIASLIFWWLKPLYDRIVLHIVSRKLFNQALTSWQVLTELPSLIWNTGFFQSITFRRLSLSRGFNLAIWQLEQLRGSKRAARQKVLHQNIHTQAVWLTIGLVIIELILWFSLFGLLYLFLPEDTAKTLFTSLFGNDVERIEWISVADYFFYILVVTLVHPFYIAANFALYINRRTQLEAWDIELDFRKMSMRLQNLNINVISSGLVTLLIALSAIAYSDASYAKESDSDKPITEILVETRLPAEKSKQVIQETMQIKELNDKKTIKYWAPKDTQKKKKSNNTNLDGFFKSLAKIMGFIIEFGLWMLVGIAVLLLIIYRKSWLGLFSKTKRSKVEEYQAPEVMFGMDVRPDSIPEDIITTVQKLLSEKKVREALSLLYRGALIRLINQEQIQLKNSHTEKDVLRVSAATLSDIKQNYLSSLTAAWKQIAYAHRNPKDQDIVYLLNSWKSEFSIQNSNDNENINDE